MKITTLLNKKNIFYMKILFTVVILFFLVRYSELNINLLYIFINHPFLTCISILACYIPVMLNTWRWYRLNYIQNIHLPFKKTLLPTYLGFAFNNILPGNIGGDFFRLYYMLKKFPQQKNGAALSVFFDRALGLMGMIFIICIFAPYYLNSTHYNKALFYLFCTCMACCISGCILFVALLFLLGKINIIDWLKKKSTSRLRWLNQLIAFLEAMYAYRNAKLIIVENILISMISQVWSLMIILFINKLMNLPLLSPLDCLIALIIGQIANLLPFTPGGIGIGEAAFANIMLMLNPGVTAPYATVFLAWRLLMTLMYLPGIVAGMMKLHRRETVNIQGVS